MTGERTAPLGRFHVMAKPTGPLCNLDCAYCYYLHKESLLESRNAWRVSDEVLEEFIRQYINGREGEEIVFSWQGGEPTLLGLDFFSKVVELEKKHCPPGKRVENDLQTNGTLLDDRWCEFLRENGFLVGLSIDGPRFLHDRFRRDKRGRPTFRSVLKAARLLRRHSVAFNTLTVVNRENASFPLAVYRFLRDDVGSKRIQFIPCVEPVGFETTAPGGRASNALAEAGSPEARPGSRDSIVAEWSVDPVEYGKFLIAFFDEWYANDRGDCYVYLFECALAQWMGMPATLCTMAPTCGGALAMEHDGAVYSCDHFVYPEYRLGNITETPLGALAGSARQTDFGQAKAHGLPAYCRECRFLFACNGECPKNRLLATPDGEGGLNYLCAGLKDFFAHVDPYMREMAAALKRRGPLA